MSAMKDTLLECFDCRVWGYNREHYDTEDIWLCNKCNNKRVEERGKDERANI